MKDSAAKGIKNAQQVGQLRKDAAVQGKRASIGKRNSSSGSGLQQPSSTPVSNSSSISGTSHSSTRSSSGISNAAGRNAARRTQNKNNIDKAINVAKKIPVANKYAKMAETIRKVQKKKQGIVSFINSKVSDDKQVSKDDMEEAASAERSGEEYKPDAAEARYTAITSRQMKFLAIFILGGVFAGGIFFCVIIVSSITDSGGRAYLATKENPTEEELGKEYDASENEDRQQNADDGTNGSTSSSSSSSSRSSSSNTSPVAVTPTGNQTIDKLNSIAKKEAENGSSASKFQEWFKSNDDWCGMFVSWLFDQVDGLDKYYVKSGFAGAGARESINKGYGTWHEDECTDSKTVPKAGDVLHYQILSTSNPNYTDKMSSKHVGYVYAVDNNKIYTVEGNYDPNKVEFVSYDRKNCKINGYYRPKY